MYRHSKKNIQKKFVINKKIVIFVLLFWVSSFFVNTWAILIMSVFCLGNALLMSIDRYISLPIDMELSNFSTILMSIHFGLGFGLLTAALTKFADMIYNKRFKITYLFMISSYMVTAYFAFVFKDTNIVTLGIVVTLVSNIYLGMIRKFVAQYSIFEVILYGGSNFIFNSVLFIGFSQIINNVLKIFS